MYVPQILSLCSRPQEPQLLGPRCCSYCLCSATSEAPAMRSLSTATREQAPSWQLEKSEKPGQQQRPSTAKNRQTNQSIVLLYTNSELSEKEIKKIYVFTVKQKKNKKPRNIFNQGSGKLAYWGKKLERHDTLMDWKNIVKMSLLSKEFCRFNVIPIELSKAFSQK